MAYHLWHWMGSKFLHNRNIPSPIEKTDTSHKITKHNEMDRKSYCSKCEKWIDDITAIKEKCPVYQKENTPVGQTFDI